MKKPAKPAKKGNKNSDFKNPARGGQGAAKPQKIIKHTVRGR